MNRRDLLKGLAAGGIFVAGELWIPGQKLISIPKPIDYSGKICFIETFTALPNGKWLKVLSNEVSIIHSEEWSFCPYVSLEPGMQYISKEYWHTVNTP